MDIIKEDIIRLLDHKKRPLSIDELFSCDYLSYAERSQIYFALETLTIQGIIQKDCINQNLPVYSI
jgi:Fe2+ or Zn2+ uptake regulation protein